MSRGKGHAENGKVVLELKGIAQSFPQADGGRLEVIRKANLSLHRGEMVALIGPSGSGKSTLLHITGMLEKPAGHDEEDDDAGTFDGAEPGGQTEKDHPDEKKARCFLGPGKRVPGEATDHLDQHDDENAGAGGTRRDICNDPDEGTERGAQGSVHGNAFPRK